MARLTEAVPFGEVLVGGTYPVLFAQSVLDVSLSGCCFPVDRETLSRSSLARKSQCTVSLGPVPTMNRKWVLN
jgi:hypothetical protein